jgi:tRNA pseudouridine38-40 synthase
LLRKAASYFIGTHDFTSFANSPNKGSASRDPVRTLKRLDVVLQEGGVRLEFEADGFLYKMVRNIVGTLLEVASGKRPLEDIPEIFAAKHRPKAASAAPPQGLSLIEVYYP